MIREGVEVLLIDQEFSFTGLQLFMINRFIFLINLSAIITSRILLIQLRLQFPSTSSSTEPYWTRQQNSHRCEENLGLLTYAQYVIPKYEHGLLLLHGCDADARRQSIEQRAFWISEIRKDLQLDYPIVHHYFNCGWGRHHPLGEHSRSRIRIRDKSAQRNTDSCPRSGGWSDGPVLHQKTSNQKTSL